MSTGERKGDKGRVGIFSDDTVGRALMDKPVVEYSLSGYQNQIGVAE